jgi:hypothetical protein
MFFSALPGEIGAIILKEHISVFRVHNSKISQTLSSIMEFRMLKPYHCNQGPSYGAYAAAASKTVPPLTHERKSIEEEAWSFRPYIYLI